MYTRETPVVEQIMTPAPPPKGDTLEAHPENIRELNITPSVNREGLSIDQRLYDLERRVDEIVIAQMTNTPILKAALERILSMRETLHNHGNALMRLEALANKAVSAQEITAASMADLVSLLKHAKTWGGRLKKYWPRIATFALGVAVTKGWITVDNGKNLIAIFGI